MDNPYQNPLPEQVFIQRTVMIDPTGEAVTLSALTERTIITPDGQRVTEVTTSLPQTAEGVLLTDLRAVYRCASCGKQPLLRVMRCGICGQSTCAPCTTVIEGETICRPCTLVPWWIALLKTIGGIASWLRPR
jgi:hypothetical protein